MPIAASPPFAGVLGVVRGALAQAIDSAHAMPSTIKVRIPVPQLKRERRDVVGPSPIRLREARVDAAMPGAGQRQAMLDVPEREFVASPLLRLEVVPQALQRRGDRDFDRGASDAGAFLSRVCVVPSFGSGRIADPS